MDNDMKEIKNDIKEIKENLHAIDKTLVKQEENLKQHMYRTDLAEQRLEHIEDSLEPIKRHVDGMSGALKLLLVVGAVLGIALTVSKLL